MATVAALQAFNNQKEAAPQLMSDAIITQLTTKCAGHDHMTFVQAMKLPEFCGARRPVLPALGE